MQERAQLRLPWLELVKPWRPYVLVAEAADAFYRPKRRVRPGISHKKQEKPAKDDPQQKFNFPPLVEVEIPLTDEELAAEFDRLFPPQ